MLPITPKSTAPIFEKLPHLPDLPGVYQYQNHEGNLLYIGKAKSLKNRIRSYFHKSAQNTLRIQIMVSLVHDVQWIVTDSEAEALILEEQLIKTYQPRYNVLLKDDKSYPYLKLTVNERFPRLCLVREKQVKGAEYYGPYPSIHDAYQILQVINRYFPLRTSKMTLDGSKTYRPCLNFQIKRCLAPCQGNVSTEEYRKIVEQVRLFLRGRDQELLRDLAERMKSMSHALEFEKAVLLRDQMSALQRIFTRQTIMNLDREDQDVFNLYRESDTAGIQVLFIRNGRLLATDFFYYEGSEQASADSLLGQVLNRIYMAESTGIPKRLLLPFVYSDQEILAQVLSEKVGRAVQIHVPQKGKKKELVLLAYKNARINLVERRQRQIKENAILQQIQKTLSLQNLPQTVEAFDISHLGGEMTVASMVCWKGNRLCKEKYRKFKLKNVEGPDDFASMTEVLTRHYRRSVSGESPLPDLILIDGGKGQLNAALAVLRQLGISLREVDIIGLAKGRSEHRRGIRRSNEEDFEYVVKPNQKNEIRLHRHSAVLYFLQNIRDEAHHFAIEYQRQLKRKENLQSLLDEIPGVGLQRKKALLKHLGSLKRIREASVTDLAKVSGISTDLATSIHQFFVEADHSLAKKYKKIKKGIDNRTRFQ